MANQNPLTTFSFLFFNFLNSDLFIFLSLHTLVFIISQEVGDVLDYFQLHQDDEDKCTV